MSDKRPYPDISGVLARKERGRRERATLSFAEKLEILDQMRAAADTLTKQNQAADASTSAGEA